MADKHIDMRLFLAAFVILLVSSCGSRKQVTPLEGHDIQWKYIPAEFHNTFLGMELENFREARPNARKDPNETDAFRDMYIEYPPEASGVFQVVYYIDTDHDVEKEKERVFRLYEYIFEYSSSDKRDRMADPILGPPNFEGTEWMFDSGEGFMIHCWKFQNKLIVAGKIARSEWE